MNTKSLIALALTIVIVCPIALGYALSVSEEEVTGWDTVETNNISDLLLNHNTPYDAMYFGTTNNTELSTQASGGIHLAPVYESITGNISPYPEIQNPDYVLTPSNGKIYLPLNYSWTWDAGEEVTFTYTFPDPDNPEWEQMTSVHLGWISGNYEISYDVNTHALTHNGGQPIIPDTTQVRSLYVSSNDPITIYRSILTGQYADVSAGWTLPQTSCYWVNGHSNMSVIFTVNLPAGASLKIGELSRVTLTNTAGTVTVNGDPFGTYQYLRVTVTEWTTTVEGLAAWPAMGSSPSTYNSTTITFEGPVNPLPNTFGLLLESSTAVKPILRVDSSQIVAGTFPSTLDYDLKLNDLYPGKTINVKLNSIGVYGDYLQIGDVTLPVHNGAVSIGGKAIGLRGALLSFFEEEGGIEARINSTVVGSFENLPTIRFGGEWSLTATAFILEQTTNSKMTWHPGEFGLDKAGFAAAGLIFAGIAFLVLGMQGRASGGKVGILLLICGGAAAVYFMII